MTRYTLSSATRHNVKLLGIKRPYLKKTNHNGKKTQFQLNDESQKICILTNSGSFDSIKIYNLNLPLMSTQYLKLFFCKTNTVFNLL